MPAPIHIVWFKRDLRVADHEPLSQACLSGPVLPLFAWEPTVIAAEDYARQHQAFAEECLMELEPALEELGLRLLQWPSGIMDALSQIRAKTPIAAIWSHEETGNSLTYEVDKQVKMWCKTHGVDWHEIPQHGVIRRLRDRDRWHGTWEKQMRSSQARLPAQIIAAPLIKPPEHPRPLACGTDKPRRQRGGRNLGLEIFNSFLEDRAAQYRPCISSPLTASRGCSRLSPYLAWGALSMREVVQATRVRQSQLAAFGPAAPRGVLSGLRAFESRLHWHCHFIQKLESEPELEFVNLHRAHDQLRDLKTATPEQKARLDAWIKGETGWPLLDACMAMLRQTGWINFRMRAMLMSTASYIYWLHWREPGLHLAREFTDYEPGIHWPQTQMQSGTTGINALRIYNPIKQAKDQDPTGTFVRRWLPQLKQVPDSWIFQPWLMPLDLQRRSGCLIERDYPAPLVEVEQATREARARIISLRRATEARQESQAIVKKHGSRKGMPGSMRDNHGREISRSRQRKKATKQQGIQQELF